MLSAHSYHHSGFYAAYPSTEWQDVQPLIKTQGFTTFTLNHLHGFYMAHPKPSPWFYVAHPKTSPWVLYGSPKTFIMGFYMDHPKPSPWVLYGSPKTFIMGFMWFTRNLHHGFYTAHPKPSSWVLYGSPKTNTMGFTITHLEKPMVSTFVW